MPHLDFEGKQYECDEDGYLVDWETWKEGMAKVMASQDGITLGGEHWEIIKFLREYFIKFQIAPMIKILVKEIGKAMGPEKGNTKYL